MISSYKGKFMARLVDITFQIAIFLNKKGQFLLDLPVIFLIQTFLPSPFSSGRYASLLFLDHISGVASLHKIWLLYAFQSSFSITLAIRDIKPHQLHCYHWCTVCCLQTTMYSFFVMSVRQVMWPNTTKSTSCRPGLFWDND